ncbi:MAG: hypothetical protein WC389_12995 [Lutibacter sp.]|jgi:hypothetical protein
MCKPKPEVKLCSNKDCRIPITIKNAYSHRHPKTGEIVTDCLCKPCRIALSAKYQKSYGKKHNKEPLEVRSKFDNLNRSTKRGFIQYMTLNAIYFEHVFGKDAIPGNILAEADKLRLEQ